MDCYVFGDDSLKTGSIVDCEIVGLLEQIESGEPDHKVLAVVAGQKAVLPDGVAAVLEDFIYGVFTQYPDSAVSLGAVQSRDAAVQYVRACRDS